MKNSNKLLMLGLTYFLMTIVSILGVNAVLNDSLTYISFDEDNISGTTLIDLAYNKNGTCLNMASNCNTIDGLILNASSFDGTDDYIEFVSGNAGWFGGPADQTISVWANFSTGNGYIYYDRGLDGIITLRRNVGTNQVAAAVYDNTAATYKTITYDVGSIIETQFNHYLIKLDYGTTEGFQFYVNGIQVGNATVTTAYPGGGTQGVWLGRDDTGASNRLDGDLDEFGIWNRLLNNSEITELYNGGNGLNPYLISQAPIVTINAPTEGQYLDSLNFTLNVSTNLNTNLSYSLNNASNVTLGTDINSSVSTITGIEGSNTIIVYSNYSGEITSDSVSFTIDTIDPVITNNIQAEYNSYTILGFNSSCSDTNINYCNISLNSQNVALNTSSFTFTENGNITYTITAEDLAGNIVTENGTILVNPYQRFYFNDGGLLSNFSFGGVTFTGDQANFTVYNDILSFGNNTLTFEKLGYVTQDFTFNINTTSNYNQTYNVSLATITINTIDKDTGNPISGVNFTLQFISSVGLTTYTDGNSQTNITNTFFQNEEYRLIVSNANYETESLFFDFTNQENLELDVYLLESNYTKLGYVVVKVVDRFSQPIENVIIKALQWDSSTSSYIDVSQDHTNELGQGNVNIILDDKLYKFRAIYQDALFDSVEQIVAAADNGKTITISVSALAAEEQYLLQNLILDIDESFNDASNTSTINVSWEDTSDIEQTICVHAFRLVGQTQTKVTNDTANCLSSDSSSIERNFLINSSQDILLKVQVKIDDDYITMKTFRYYSNTHISEVLESLSLQYFVVTILNLIAISLALYMQNVYIGSLLLILSGILSMVLVPSIVTGGIVAFFIFVGIVTIIGGQK